MNKHIILIFIFLLIIITSRVNIIKAQGCSDAGACSIGSMDDHEEGREATEPSRVKLSVEQSIGLGEKFTFISQTSFMVEYRFLRTTSLLLRAPFIFTSGNLGNSSGVGDLTLSLIQQLYQNDDSHFGLLVAGKIRSNNADLSFAGNPLPMAYQTSLGTYDIIIGAQYLYKTWDFYIAYQHPFNRNQNEYLNPAGETDESKLYFESANLKRGDDLAMRVQKTFLIKNRQSLQPGIMSIYRIQESEITRFDRNVVLDNSSGLTFNLYLTWAKRIKNDAMIYLSGAFPVIDRDYRADGLTRNFVLTFRITQFW